MNQQSASSSKNFPIDNLVYDLMMIIAKKSKGLKAMDQYLQDAQNNQRVKDSFEKIRKHLLGFECKWDARRGAQQLLGLFRQIDMTEEVFQFRTFTRLKQLEHLIRTRQIDENFFWTEPNPQESPLGEPIHALRVR